MSSADYTQAGSANASAAVLQMRLYSAEASVDVDVILFDLNIITSLSGIWCLVAAMQAGHCPLPTASDT